MYLEQESLSTDAQAMEGRTEAQQHVLTPPWLRALGAKMQQRTASLARSIVRLPGKTKIYRLSAQRAYGTIPFGIIVGVTGGAVAFGFWWKSIAAGVFACSVLFLLAGIYEAMERIVEAVPRREDGNSTVGADPDYAPARTESSYRNIDTLVAIGRLKSWVTNETSPTEEDVKQSCAVLLKLVPPK